mmetsp:Transcript_28956/g.53000  ORF Transcript_28956/g.53000 Transcript_28956/m.53000 type:complete len:112 (-) Transcript_28956:148-483(-)
MKTCFSLLSLLVVIATFVPSTEARVTGGGRKLFGSDADTRKDIYDRCCVENTLERNCKSEYSGEVSDLMYQGCCCPIREEDSKYGDTWLFRKYAGPKWAKKCDKLAEEFGR